MEVYSYSGVKFNALVYCMVRGFYVPELEGLEPKDTWFAVPAVQMGPLINLAFAKLELASLMMVDHNGRVIKAFRVNLQAPPVLEGYELETVKNEAFSIPLWEQTNQRAFPYDLMFNKQNMTERYTRAGAERQQIMSGGSNNNTYNKIYANIKRKGGCTTCGGKNRAN